MIAVALAAALGLWLAGNRLRAGWALAAGAYGLWLAGALASEQYGAVVPVLACGAVCVRNARAGRRRRARRPRRRRVVASWPAPSVRGGPRWPT
jgi:hypothetical protein